ncbi:MAG TPA: amidase family protein, partial [Pseudomonadales bacterium]
GLVGLRSSYGRIPTFGDTHLAQNAVVGAVTTTVADTALLLDVMAGPDARDRTCLPAPGFSYLRQLDVDLPKLRIAWSLDLGFAVVDPEVAALTRGAAERLISVAAADEVDAKIHLDDYIGIYGKIEGVDKFVGVDRELWEQRLDELDPLVAPGWRKAQTVTLPKSAVVEAARRRLVHQIAACFERIDLLLTPMVAAPAFAAEGPMPTTVAGVSGHAGMHVIHGMLANLCNLPAISIPAGMTKSGLPVGLQIVAPRFREDLLLAVAHRYQLAHPWPRHAS